VFVGHLSIAVAQGYSLDPDFVGHWLYKSADAIATLAIEADGTWSGTLTLPGQPEDRFEGRWTTDGEFIYWFYTKSSTPKIKPGAQDKDKIVEVGKDYFVLHTQHDHQPKYVRVK